MTGPRVGSGGSWSWGGGVKGQVAHGLGIKS